jgi:hypothetical protein
VSPLRWLVRVELPGACFGFEVNPGGRVVRAAPIARWTLDRPARQVVAHYCRRGARVTWRPVPEEVTPLR